MSAKAAASENMSGGHSMPLSVPKARSAPAVWARAMGGTLPKYLLDVGHTTIGTSASAHLARSESAASHICTTNAGSRDRTKSMSSRTLSLTWIAKIFLLSRTASAIASMS